MVHTASRGVNARPHNPLVYAQRVAVAEARLPDWEIEEAGRTIKVCGKASLPSSAP